MSDAERLKAALAACDVFRSHAETVAASKPVIEQEMAEEALALELLRPRLSQEPQAVQDEFRRREHAWRARAEALLQQWTALGDEAARLAARVRELDAAVRRPTLTAGELREALRAAAQSCLPEVLAGALRHLALPLAAVCAATKVR